MYEKIIREGKEFFLCWNCGRIETEYSATQTCIEDMNFIERCINKKKLESKKSV